MGILSKLVNMKKLIIAITTFTLLSLSLSSFCLPQTVLAGCKASGTSQSVLGPDIFDGTPQLGCEGDDSNAIQLILKTVFGILAVLSVIFVAIGGIRYAISGGDANAIASAKKTITYALIGLVLGVSVFIIVNFIFKQVSSI